MLTYADIFRRSLILAATMVAADLVVAFLPISTLIDISFAGIVGDLLLLEVAAVFLAAGVVDFSSSLGMTAFRRLLSSRVEYSAIRRKEAEQSALMLLVAGSILLLALITLSCYDWFFAS
jgi:hypothetical protein